MYAAPARRSALPLLAQLLVAMLLVPAVLAAPPARGRMLLVPIADSDSARLLAAARRADALLVGSGPWPGSLVVQGSRAALLRPMLAAGVLVTSAPAAGCGPAR